MRRFKATVQMKKPWVDEWIKKPSVDDVLEALADAIRSGEIDQLFEVKIVEVKKKMGI
jgi:hypothetical protein